ncbi:MAG: response regulator [bacterium]
MALSGKILLVDDEEAFVRHLGRRLRAEGLEVREAASGPQALDVLERESFEVVILDMLMPGMDGLEVLKKIKEVHPLTEVMILTGHGSVSSGVAALKMGAFDYLMKPCELDDLLDRIRRAREKKEIEEGRALYG